MGYLRKLGQGFWESQGWLAPPIQPFTANDHIIAQAQLVTVQDELADQVESEQEQPQAETLQASANWAYLALGQPLQASATSAG